MTILESFLLNWLASLDKIIICGSLSPSHWNANKTVVGGPLVLRLVVVPGGNNALVSVILSSTFAQTSSVWLLETEALNSIPTLPTPERDLESKVLISSSSLNAVSNTSEIWVSTLSGVAPGRTAVTSPHRSANWGFSWRGKASYESNPPIKMNNMLR